MALIVEDGTGMADAESYVSVAELDAYCVLKGITLASAVTADKEAALRRATDAIDAIYRSRFPGDRRQSRNQAKEWPRIDAVDVRGFTVAYDSVPIEIREATCEAAVREVAAPGAMAPDLERGGAIRSVKAGSVAIEYGADASAVTVFTAINGRLSGLLIQVKAFSGGATRG